MSNSRHATTMSLEQAISEMMKAFALEKKFREKQIAACWGEMMGEAVAARTQEVYVFEEKLFVKLTSAPLRHEISLMKSKILAAILLRFGDAVIKDIVLL